MTYPRPSSEPPGHLFAAFQAFETGLPRGSIVVPFRTRKETLIEPLQDPFKRPDKPNSKPQKVGNRIKDNECWDSLYMTLKD